MVVLLSTERRSYLQPLIDDFNIRSIFSRAIESFAKFDLEYHKVPDKI